MTIDNVYYLCNKDQTDLKHQTEGITDSIMLCLQRLSNGESKETCLTSFYNEIRGYEKKYQGGSTDTMSAETIALTVCTFIKERKIPNITEFDIYLALNGYVLTCPQEKTH